MPLPHVRVMCVTAVFMALTAISGMWSLPVGIAHIYLTDVIVCIAALLLPPSWACAAGGLGAFLGDLMFYPQAMFVTLITRTVQSLVIGLMKKGLFRKHPLLRDALAVAAGAVIMVCGYTVGHMVMYGSFETTLISYVLPQVIQAVFGAAVALMIVHVFHLEKRMQKLPV
ncbi:MAG: ECF transporter S component [Clostridiales bacterium]|nr:ECF transporter S component [Clostridiales bacterium]